MDWFWDVVLRAAATFAGVAFYAWLLSYKPGGSGTPGPGDGHEGP